MQVPTSFEPHSYSSGHWLRADQQQRDARYVDFDFPALSRKVLEKFPTAHNVVRCEKKEGSYNRVFTLHLDNGERGVARIPFRIAGPPRLVTHSEVATMEYIRLNTKIPVPRVLGWSDDGANSIGTEYIIMEHVDGVQLAEQWPSMNIVERLKSTQALGRLAGEMAKLQFPAYGSLYFRNAPFDSSLKIDISEDFCIGPHCGGSTWPCNPMELVYYDEKMSRRGPWTDLKSYAADLIDSGLAKLPHDDSVTNRLEYEGNVGQHKQLLSQCKDIIKKLIAQPAIQDISRPLLLHHDMNQRNVFISKNDPSLITAVIDWQSTSIDPLFWRASETPDVATPTPVLRSILDGEDTTDEEKNDPAIKKELENLTILQKCYELMIYSSAEDFAKARAVDADLYRIMEYCASSWRLSAAMLRQEMIDLSQKWPQLGLPGECPYTPTHEELEDHKLLYEDFQNLQQLKMFLVKVLMCNSEGWVHNDDWEYSKNANKALYEQWMHSSRTGDDANLTPEKAAKLYPFDTD